MSVLLTHGYFLHEDSREKKIMKPYPPLGILYVSSALQKAKIDHDVFDSTFSDFETLTAQILQKKYKQIGIYANMLTKLNVLKLIRFIRSKEELKDTTIILGGPDVRYNVDNYMNNGADMIVLGEGEQTMVDLINTLNTPFNPFLDKVQGIAFRNYFGKVVYTDERPQIKDTDEILIPNRGKIDIKKYLSVWKKHHGVNALNINTQRGCPYTCKWCSTAVYGQSYRRRSPQKVCDEIEELIRTYNPDTFWFVDDVFTVSHKWLSDFAFEIDKRQLKIKYECITRADRMNDNVIFDLKRSGCYRVWIGAESGSQEVIDNMDRRVDVKIVQEMLVKAKNAGIETGTFIMLGYPGETQEDIVKTIDHLVASDPTYFTITIAYPIKGTGLYENAKNMFIKELDWTTSTDRDIDFKRTYPREYYDYAVSFVTNEVKLRLLKGLEKWLYPHAWKYRLKSILAQERMQKFRPNVSKAPST
jgi:anaerobic magnesium-protoporphyrin IX monomethyl ester cyclase